MKKILLLCLTLSLHASIHIIGDSHVRAFEGIPNCVLHYMGPVLMHRVGRDALNIVDLRKLEIPKEEIVVYAFGEIDVRCHVLKQRDLANRTLEEIIDTLAKKYLSTILINQILYQPTASIVYNVIPPLADGGRNPDYPIYGTIHERINATKLLNAKIRKLCIKHGFYFLDTYDLYALEDGSLNFDISDANVHIDAKHNRLIQQQLSTLLSEIAREDTEKEIR